VTSVERHHTTHTIDIDAPRDVVYGIVADAASWPLHFTPSIHVRRTALDGSAERLQIWASAGGQVKTWTSRRDLDPQHHRIAFRQEVCSPPVAAMGGEWVLGEAPAGGTRVTFHHDFEAVDDDPAGVEWINNVVESNTTMELADIKALAENVHRRRELTLSFEDSVLVHGSPDAVFDFLYQAKRWPERLPHVAEMDLREDVPNVQSMRMCTSAADGSVHTTESVRICFPESRRIVYKQLVTPPLMTAHIGAWTIRQAEEGVRVTSWHSVVVNESAIRDVLGPDGTVDAARTLIRNALGGNSRATLGLAKEFAEARDA
jgi:aromatase/bifunctional cyclase/aromatase